MAVIGGALLLFGCVGGGGGGAVMSGLNLNPFVEAFTFPLFMATALAGFVLVVEVTGGSTRDVSRVEAIRVCAATTSSGPSPVRLTPPPH